MPIYEYRCESCGHQQEFLLKVSDAPLTVCTKCGKATFSKMVTAAGFQLKGSGWYATDFRNSGAKPKAADTSSTPSGEAKGEAKSESKGEAKSESKGEAKSESKGEAKSESKGEGDKKPAAPPPASPSK
jgi:putative FmdB family regulatory protein